MSNVFTEQDETATVKLKNNIKKHKRSFSLWEPQTDRFYSLPSGKFKIGKSGSNEVILDFPTISRFHAECRITGEKLLITDLKSRNGIFFNNKRINTTEINPGEMFVLGDNPVVFVEGNGKTSEYGGLKTRNLKFSNLLKDLIKTAKSNLNVLITGESGSGKEVAANLIKNSSGLFQAPFVVLNCGAIPVELMESELFGHVKGAFTGAFTNKEGMIKAADGGFLFLDEIAELHPRHQAGLLRFLENGSYRPVGSSKEYFADVRIIAATHKNLSEEIDLKRFRLDLYYRLSSLNFEIPPLRQRKEDIPLFFGKFGYFGRPSNIEWIKILNYQWFGNVRELKSAVSKTNLFGWDSVIKDFNIEKNIKIEIPEKVEIKNPFKESEKQICMDAVKKSGGNIARAAKLLGLPRTTLIGKLKRLNINIKDREYLLTD